MLDVNGIDESTFILDDSYSSTEDEHNDNNDDMETDIF